jgi:hypothetical protein
VRKEKDRKNKRQNNIVRRTCQTNMDEENKFEKEEEKEE